MARVCFVCLGHIRSFSPELRRTPYDRLTLTLALDAGTVAGAVAGLTWGIGLMGSSSTPRHVELCLGALEGALG